MVDGPSSASVPSRATVPQNEDIWYIIALQIGTIEDVISLYQVLGIPSILRALLKNNDHGLALFAGILARNDAVFDMAVHHVKNSDPGVEAFNACLPVSWFAPQLGLSHKPQSAILCAAPESARQMRGYSVLQASIVAGHVPYVVRLLKAGADPSYSPPQPCWACVEEPLRDRSLPGFHLQDRFLPHLARRSPLHIAICHGQMEAAEALLNHGAEGRPDLADLETSDHRFSAGQWHAPHTENEKASNVLHDLCGVYPPESPDPDPDPDRQPTIRIARLYLAKTPTALNQPTSWGEEPLARACRTGHFRYALWLTEQPGVYIRNTVPWAAGNSLVNVALRAAVCFWSAEAPAQDPRDGRTPNFYLAARRDLGALPKLIATFLKCEAGLNVDVPGSDGSCALHLCARLGGDMTDPSPGTADIAPIIHQLLNHGADVWRRDRLGLTPLDVVKRFHSPVTGASAWNTRASLLDGGQAAEGHVPGKFVPLLNRVRETAGLLSDRRMFPGDSGDHQRFSIGYIFCSMSRAKRHDLWWTHAPAGPRGLKLLAQFTTESGLGAPSSQLDLAIPSISRLSWAATDGGPYRIILTLTSGVPYDRGRSLHHDEVFIEFGDDNYNSAELHYHSFLSWSEAFLPWKTEISNDELSERWDSANGG